MCLPCGLTLFRLAMQSVSKVESAKTKHWRLTRIPVRKTTHMILGVKLAPRIRRKGSDGS